MDVEDIKKIIKSLPDEERAKPVIAIEGKVFTWADVLKEMDTKSPLAEKMQEKIGALLE